MVSGCGSGWNGIHHSGELGLREGKGVMLLPFSLIRADWPQSCKDSVWRLFPLFEV